MYAGRAGSPDVGRAGVCVGRVSSRRDTDREHCSRCPDEAVTPLREQCSPNGGGPDDDDDARDRATGQIGTALVPELVAKGVTVRAMTRRPTGSRGRGGGRPRRPDLARRGPRRDGRAVPQHPLLRAGRRAADPVRRPGGRGRGAPDRPALPARRADRFPGAVPAVARRGGGPRGGPAARADRAAAEPVRAGRGRRGAAGMLGAPIGTPGSASSTRATSRRWRPSR